MKPSASYLTGVKLQALAGSLLCALAVYGVARFQSNSFLLVDFPSATRVESALGATKAALSLPPTALFSAALTEAKSVGRVAATYVLTATAYNSLPDQTSSHPYITASGMRVRLGVIAVSRNLLGRLPFGTRVRIEDLSRPGGAFAGLMSRQVFVVADLLGPQAYNQIDIWMRSYGSAIRWGVRKVKLSVLS